MKFTAHCLSLLYNKTFVMRGMPANFGGQQKFESVIAFFKGVRKVSQGGQWKRKWSKNSICSPQQHAGDDRTPILERKPFKPQWPDITRAMQKGRASFQRTCAYAILGKKSPVWPAVSDCCQSMSHLLAVTASRRRLLCNPRETPVGVGDLQMSATLTATRRNAEDGKLSADGPSALLVVISKIFRWRGVVLARTNAAGVDVVLQRRAIAMAKGHWATRSAFKTLFFPTAPAQTA